MYVDVYAYGCVWFNVQGIGTVGTGGTKGTCGGAAGSANRAAVTKPLPPHIRFTHVTSTGPLPTEKPLRSRYLHMSVTHTLHPLSRSSGFLVCWPKQSNTAQS